MERPALFFLLCTIAICTLVPNVSGQQIVGLSIATTPSFSNVKCSDKTTTSCVPIYCGAAGQPTCASQSFTTPPPVQGRWGASTDNSRSSKSGLGFNPNSPVVTSVDQDFYLGVLTHFNFPIYAYSAADSIVLTLKLDFSNSQTGAFIATNSFSFTFLINETDNGVPLSKCYFPSTTPCADQISFPDGGFDRSSSFSLNGVSYTLQLKGFKDGASSTSLPLTSFISNEGGSRNGYLFARITAACPNSCVGGGAVYVNSNQQCVCDCTSATPCGTGKHFAPNCSCLCDTGCNNGGTQRPTDCSCNCATATACPTPKVFDGVCNCQCPAGYCNSGTANAADCSCTCPPINCGPNFQVSPTCLCTCPLTCTLPKVRVPDSGICDCYCPNTCGAGFTLNTTTCNCDCGVVCPNGARIDSTCSCGPCYGNWTKDPQGKCTICGLTDCGGSANARIDYDACACVCSQLTCDLFNNGQVVDTNAFCACRNCTAGECVCGNGKVEPGEDCDLGNTTNPCCKNCKFTQDVCDDGDPCIIGDRCDGQGHCIASIPKCPGATTCNSYVCNQTNGDCIENRVADNTTCESGFGANDANLCVQRCWQGACTPYPTSGPLAKDCSYDPDPTDCYTPKCVPATGQCEFFVVDDGTPCSDGKACTYDDQCTAGVCKGVTRTCIGDVNVTQCQDPYCEEGFSSYICKPKNKRNGLACVGTDKCSLVNLCSNGACRPAGLTPRCPVNTQCTTWYCDPSTGECASIRFGNDTLCNDRNNCTVNDHCEDGVCVGEASEETKALPQCGAVIPPPNNKGGNNALIIFAAAGGAALIGAIIGAALIVKKIQRSKLLDPQTWNPDMFSSVGTNPLFQGSQKMVENPLAE